MASIVASIVAMLRHFFRVTTVKEGCETIVKLKFRVSVYSTIQSARIVTALFTDMIDLLDNGETPLAA